ncbi:MAG: nitronate monooxygenase [Desulfobacterales bacterium]
MSINGYQISPRPGRNGLGIRPALAAAAYNAGILGTLGLGSMTPEEVDENIEQMKKTTCQSFAVNIPLLRPDAADLVARAHEKEVPVYNIGQESGRIASFCPAAIRHMDSRSAIGKGAQKAEQIRVDAVVCEGYEAGGRNSLWKSLLLHSCPR